MRRMVRLRARNPVDAPTCSDRENRELFALRGTGRWPEARTRLILGNVGLVGRLAGLWAAKHAVEWEEFYAAGMIGLIGAVDRYDPDHPSGAKFGTFAEMQVLGHAQKYIARPQPENVARIDPDWFGNDPGFDACHAPMLARDALGLLRRRERLVVELYYGLDGNGGRTFREIAIELNLSRQRADQLHKRAMGRLREACS